MKLVKLLMTLIILQLLTSSAFSQLLLHTRELCMKIRNGERNGTITFFTQSEGSTVWDR